MIVYQCYRLILTHMLLILFYFSTEDNAKMFGVLQKCVCHIVAKPQKLQLCCFRYLAHIYQKNITAEEGKLHYKLPASF